MDLQPGQNISISKQNPAPTAVEVRLSWEPASTPLTIDSSAFALMAQGKVRDDGDFIFYNQLALAGGGLQRAGEHPHERQAHAVATRLGLEDERRRRIWRSGLSRRA